MSAQPNGLISIAACCGAFLLSCYVSVKGHTALSVILAVLAALLTVSAIVLRGRTHLASRFLPVLCFIAAGALLSLFHRLYVELPAYSHAGEGVRITALVRDVQQSQYSMSALLELKSADGTPARGKLKLELEEFAALEELDTVELTADISVYPEQEGTLFSGSPNRSRDIFLSATLTPNTDITVSPASPSLSLVLWRLKSGIKGILEDKLWREGDFPSEQAALTCGIFLGERDGISYAVKGDFNRTGISHILSVSGMHLTILIGSLFSLLCALGVHRRAACVSVMAAALLYMALCGFVPSATRAGVMALFYYTALLFGRDSHAPSSLFMAGCAICAVNPYTVADVSFMLSFLATLGIVTVSPFLSKITKAIGQRSRLFVPLSTLISGFGITGAAVFFTLPVTCAVFGTLSVVSPVANLAAAPFVQLIMVLSPLLAAFSFVPVVSDILSAVIYACCDILTAVAYFLSEPDWALAALSYPGLAAVSAIGVLFAFLPFYARGKWRIIFSSALALCIVAGGGIYAYGRAWDYSHTQVLYTARGSGQQLILSGKSGGADIIDLSDGSRSQLYAISKAMTKSGDTSVSSMVFSCLHPTHPAFLEAMLEHMPVHTVYLPLTQLREEDMEVRRTLESLALEAGCDIIYYRSDIATPRVSLYISVIRADGSVQTMAEADTEDMRILYLSRGQAEAFSWELEGEYDGVILGTHGSSLDEQKYLKLEPKHFALYTTYNYNRVSLAPKLPSPLLKHLTDNGLPLYNAAGALYTRFTQDKGIIKTEIEYE